MAEKFGPSVFPFSCHPSSCLSLLIPASLPVSLLMDSPESQDRRIDDRKFTKGFLSAKAVVSNGIVRPGTNVRCAVGACNSHPFRHNLTMPLIKLNRINKGGEILLNTEHIVFIETEARTTTVHLTDRLLFSVEEAPAAIAERVEQLEVARIKNAIVESGVSDPPAG